MKKLFLSLLVFLFFSWPVLTIGQSTSIISFKNQVKFKWGGPADSFFGLISSRDSYLIINGVKHRPYLPDQAAIGKFTSEGQVIWIKTDDGFSDTLDSFSGINSTAIIDNNIFWIIDDYILIKIDSNGNTIWKKSLDNIAGSQRLFITNWQDTIVAVQEKNNANVILLNENGLIRTFPMQANGYGWMTPRVKGDTLWISSNNSMFGTYVGQYNLQTGQRNWIFYTPDDSFKSFRSMIEIDSEGNVYCAGSKLSGNGNQKFFAYSLTPAGQLRWYTEWLPSGDWRLNYGNWAQSMAVSNYGILFVGGEVERYRQPVDPNEYDSYLALLRTDNGQLIEEQTWNYENGSRFSVNMDAVFADKKLIILGDAGNGPRTTWTWGYLRFYDLLTSVDDKPEITPTTFNLAQNYPNPFNSSTTISFTIPETGIVTLKVYDVLGREVATLVNENLNAGSHSYNFDAGNLTSGVYLSKLQAGKQSEIKKMILMK